MCGLVQDKPFAVSFVLKENKHQLRSKKDFGSHWSSAHLQKECLVQRLMQAIEVQHTTDTCGCWVLEIWLMSGETVSKLHFFPFTFSSQALLFWNLIQTGLFYFWCFLPQSHLIWHSSSIYIPDSSTFKHWLTQRSSILMPHSNWYIPSGDDFYFDRLFKTLWTCLCTRFFLSALFLKPPSALSACVTIGLFIFFYLHPTFLTHITFWKVIIPSPIRQ